MDKVPKLPSTHGIANPLGKSRRDRPKGREKDAAEEEKRRRKEEWERAAMPDPEESDRDPGEEAPVEEKRGLLLDEKA